MPKPKGNPKTSIIIAGVIIAALSVSIIGYFSIPYIFQPEEPLIEKDPVKLTVEYTQVGLAGPQFDIISDVVVFFDESSISNWFNLTSNDENIIKEKFRITESLYWSNDTAKIFVINYTVTNPYDGEKETRFYTLARIRLEFDARWQGVWIVWDNIFSNKFASNALLAAKQVLPYRV